MIIRWALARISLQADLLPQQVVYDETGRVWIMLHSGSRNIGNITATHYDKMAKEGLQQRGITTPHNLNYLEIDSEEGQQYLQVAHFLLCAHTASSCCRWCLEHRQSEPDGHPLWCFVDALQRQKWSACGPLPEESQVYLCLLVKSSCYFELPTPGFAARLGFRQAITMMAPHPQMLLQIERTKCPQYGA